MRRKRSQPVLWYENTEGVRWHPPADFNGQPPPPPGFIYQVWRNPFELHNHVIACRLDGGSEKILDGSSTWPPDLALALTRPSLWERIVATLRYGWPRRRLPFDLAILRAAGCERCMNELAHRAGLSWGYRRGSRHWRLCRTSCEWCEPDAVVRHR